MKVELLRCGAIVEDSDGFLRVVKRHAVPENFSEKLVTSIAFNLRGLASTVAHNSNPNRSREDGRIERFVQSRGLTEKQRISIRSILRQRITEFTEEIDDQFSSLDEKSDVDAGRIGVGIYYYEDD